MIKDAITSDRRICWKQRVRNEPLDELPYLGSLTKPLPARAVRGSDESGLPGRFDCNSEYMGLRLVVMVDLGSHAVGSRSDDSF